MFLFYLLHEEHHKAIKKRGESGKCQIKEPKNKKRGETASLLAPHI